MSVQEVIALISAIVVPLSGAIGLVWRAGEQKAQRIEAVYDLLVKSKDEEIGRWQQLVAQLRDDTSISRAADQKLAETFATLRETVLAALPVPPGRRAR